jgi:hypothetical protein
MVVPEARKSAEREAGPRRCPATPASRGRLALTGRAGFPVPGGCAAPSKAGANACARLAPGSARATRPGVPGREGFPDRIRGNDNPSPRRRPARAGSPSPRPATTRGAPGRAERTGSRHQHLVHRARLARRARRGLPGPPRHGRSPRVPGAGDRPEADGPCAGSLPSQPRFAENRHRANLHGGDTTVGSRADGYRPACNESARLAANRAAINVHLQLRVMAADRAAWAYIRGKLRERGLKDVRRYVRCDDRHARASRLGDLPTHGPRCTILAILTLIMGLAVQSRY